jgi:branched-chain amino acid transport system permease protein
MNLINFAYGILLVAAGYGMYVLGDVGVPFVVTVPACVLLVAALSMAMGRIAFRPFIGAPPITLLITSFGVLLIVQYALILLFGERPRVPEVPAFLKDVIELGGLRIPLLQLITIASGAVVLVGFWQLLNRTGFGAQLRASAELPDVARLMGVKPDRVLMLVFAISGVIAGIVGVLWFVKVGAVTPRSDLEPTLKAFIALVLGGLGSASGAVVGGLSLGAIEVLMATTLPDGALMYSQGIVFAIVIAILILRPGGIGRRLSETT